MGSSTRRILTTPLEKMFRYAAVLNMTKKIPLSVTGRGRWGTEHLSSLVRVLTNQHHNCAGLAPNKGPLINQLVAREIGTLSKTAQDDKLHQERVGIFITSQLSGGEDVSLLSTWQKNDGHLTTNLV